MNILHFKRDLLQFVVQEQADAFQNGVFSHSSENRDYNSSCLD